MADLITMMAAAAGTSAGGDYQISRSLRFNSADSAYLSRTPASAGNRKTWTWSGWVKRGALGGDNAIFTGYGNGTQSAGIYFSNDTVTDALEVRFGPFSGGWQGFLVTTQVFRDPSAWYHIVFAADTTQATSTNRLKLYVNGVQVTAFHSSAYPSQNADGFINQAQAHEIGRLVTNNGYLFDGYQAECHFIDGQALTPSSFGETDAVTGVWKPKAYAGTYGTNGFHLDFSDNTSTTTLGYDVAGSNDWTLNNFSVAAGAGNDSLVDVPTRNTEDVDTGAGGEVRGNYATFNVLDPAQLAGQYLISNGNLDITSTTSTYNSYAPATIALPSSGKYYFEYTCTNPDGGQRRDTIGLAQTTASGIWLGNTGSIGYDAYEGKVNNNGSNIATYASWNNGDVVSVAVDCDTGYVWFGKNGTWQAGSPSAGTGATATLSNISTYAFAVGTRAASSAGYSVKGSANFGQRPFAYTAPSGFKALCTTNLPNPTVVQGDDYFNTVLYTGTGASLGVTGVGFQPDFVWIKERSGATDHGLYDAVRGVQNQLESNTTTAETTEATGLTAFGTDGFTVGALAQLNTNTDTYVAWNWKANGAGVSNTDGTITSTVSANTTAGISIVTYTGNSASDQTVGHGLGVTPSMIIVKSRGNTDPWVTYHAPLGPNKFLYLNQTTGESTVAGYWGTPSSTTFGIKGGGWANNTNATAMVAYCFAEVEGFSKFGSYTGNASADGPFMYTGFRPAFVMMKRTDSTSDWLMLDGVRGPYNVVQPALLANKLDAEFTSTYSDFLSNGFKFRDGGSGLNISGGTYIYMAFAENPFKNALAR